MDASIRVSGLEITWKALASTVGQTGESMKESTLTTRSMVSGGMCGLTVVSTKAIGSRGNSMD